MIVDTGIGLWPAALIKSFTDANRILERARKVVEPPFQAGGGAGGAVSLLTMRADAISVGTFTSPGPVVMLFRTDSGAASFTKWDGYLGGDFLRRFTLTIDYPGLRLFLEPNRSFQAPAQALDGSGLAIRSDPGKFLIRRVLPGSAGAAAGLKDGDTLLSIDGISAADLTMTKIHEKFYRSTGTCAVRVQHGDKQLDVVVKLAPPF